MYTAIVLKNRIILIGLIPVVIGVLIGLFYRFKIKPSKKLKKVKKTFLVISLLAATMLSIAISIFSIETLSRQRDNPDTEGYKILSVENFSEKAIEEDLDFRRNISFLIPVSYEYSSYPKYPTKDNYVRTEYSNTLTKGIAKNLVNRYKKQAENDAIDRNSLDLEISFEEERYDDYLQTDGLSEEDFNKLKEKDSKKAIKEAENIIKEKSISKDKEKLWNVDEAYFLNYEKTEIVIREGKEVFYLEGRDFTDPEIIKIVKDELEL